MASVESLTTKLNGLGVHFKDFFYKSSPLFSAIFYDWATLLKPKGSLKPKSIKMSSALLEDGYTIKWRDTDRRRKGSTVDGAVSGGATSLTVADGTIFAAGDNIYFPEENFTHVVTGVSGNDLTINPAVGTGGIGDTSDVKIITSTIDNRGTLNGKAVSIEVGDEITNYIQHVSRSASFNQEDLNKIILKYQGYGMNEKAAVAKYTTEVLEEGLRQVQQDFVNAFFVGTKREETIGGKTHRFTGGINEFAGAAEDVTDSDAAGRLQKIINALDEVQGIQSMDGMYSNILVVTRRAAAKIAIMAAGYVDVTESIDLDKIGMRIKVIRTTYGDIPMYIDPVMTEIFGDANVGFVMNPQMISIVSTSNMPANKSRGGNDSNSVEALSGIQFYKDETAAKQPNSDAIINLYTNFGFMFQGSGLGLYKKLINLGE